MERAKQEVFLEAKVIADLDDHPSMPCPSGVCNNKAPFYSVLDQHDVERLCLTLSKALATSFIVNVYPCLKVLRET